MMASALDFPAQQSGMSVRDSRDQNTLFSLKQFAGDFEHLLRCFACAKNHFRKAFAQCSVQIDLRKTQVSHRRSLKRSHHLVAANTTGTKLFEEFNGFLRGHARKVAEKAHNNNLERSGGKT